MANSYSGHPLLNAPAESTIQRDGAGDKTPTEKSAKVKAASSTPPPVRVATPPPQTSTLPARSSTPLRCSICDYATTHKDHLAQHLMAHAAADNRDLANIFGLDQLRMKQQPPPPLQQQQPQQQQPQPQAPINAQPPPIKASGTTEMQVKDYINRMLSNPLLLASRMASTGLAQALPTLPATAQVERPLKALDLSRDKDDSAVPHKHRRKGQAFKLERSSVMRPATSGAVECQSPPLSQSAGTPSPPAHPLEEEDELKTTKVEEGTWGGAYQCAYCDIAFKDVVMYTMHMGYHGYQDPFTCNMCGHQTHDKLAFFLHIARSSHS